MVILLALEMQFNICRDISWENAHENCLKERKDFLHKNGNNKEIISYLPKKYLKVNTIVPGQLIYIGLTKQIDVSPFFCLFLNVSTPFFLKTIDTLTNKTILLVLLVF